MNTEDSYVNGTIFYRGSKEQLSSILETAGISNEVGEWAIRFNNCKAQFKISYVGNITPEQPFDVEADGYNVSTTEVSQWCEKLSNILKAELINFEITHFSSKDEEICIYSV